MNVISKFVAISSIFIFSLLNSSYAYAIPPPNGVYSGLVTVEKNGISSFCTITLNVTAGYVSMSLAPPFDSRCSNFLFFANPYSYTYVPGIFHIFGVNLHGIGLGNCYGDVDILWDGTQFNIDNVIPGAGTLPNCTIVGIAS